VQTVTSRNCDVGSDCPTKRENMRSIEITPARHPGFETSEVAPWVAVLACHIRSIIRSIVSTWQFLFAFVDAHSQHQDIRIHLIDIPMTSPQSTLTKAESLLFPISARLVTAFRYKEANPGGDFSHFVGKIEEEVVRHMRPSHS